MINRKTHAEYLKEIGKLIDFEKYLNKLGIERLNMLAAEIEKFEKHYYKFEKPTAIQAIKFRMECQGLKQKDLIKYFGQASKVSEALAGKTSLKKEVIKRLHLALGIPLEILMQ